MGREEEIKKFVLKYFEKAFEDQIVEKFERIDATERIEKSGFQKEISAWRNTYKNIVVCSCMVVKGVQKRYDYKFYFVEEKLNEQTIEIVEDALAECSRLIKRFQFDDALKKVDEMIELIRKEEDRVYDKRLFNFRKEIIEAQKEYEKLLKKLAKLEENIKINQEKQELEPLIKNCKEIIPIAKEVKRSDLVKLYTDTLEEAEKELNFQKEFQKLENEFNSSYSKKDYEKSLTICEKIIELCDLHDKTELSEKYSNILEQLKNEIKEKQLAEEREKEELKAFSNLTNELINLSKEGIALVNRNAYFGAFDIYEKIINKME